jgi:hypothetical protein
MQISSADRVQLNQKEQTDVRNAITLTSTDLKQLLGSKPTWTPLSVTLPNMTSVKSS